MKGPPGSAAALALLLAAFPAASGEIRVEGGAFYHDLDGGQPEWLGERLLLRGAAGARTTLQLELVDEERGDERGQLASAAAWVDWTPRLFTFTALTASQGASFFPDRRWDQEVHVKLPPGKRLVLFLGGGEAEFPDSHAGFWTAGTTWYSEKAVLSYRFYRFDNRARSAGAYSGRGSTHLVEAILGREEKGEFGLRWLQGQDLLFDFSATGADASLRSTVLTAGWRRLWSERWGSHLFAEWEGKEDLFTRRGVEVRLLYRAGPKKAKGG